MNLFTSYKSLAQGPFVEPNYSGMAQQMATDMTSYPSEVTNVNQLVKKALGLGNIAIYVLVSLGVVFIVWNVVMYIIRGDDPSGKKTALANVGWGILGLAIIVSLWGLVNIVTSSFRTNTNNVPNLPNADFVTKDR